MPNPHSLKGSALVKALAQSLGFSISTGQLRYFKRPVEYFIHPITQRYLVTEQVALDTQAEPFHNPFCPSWDIWTPDSAWSDLSPLLVNKVIQIIPSNCNDGSVRYSADILNPLLRSIGNGLGSTPTEALCKALISESGNHGYLLHQLS